MFFSQLLLVAMVGIGRSCAENPIAEQLHDAEPAINAVLEQLRGTTPSKAGAGIAIADARPSNSMDVIKSAIGDAAENGRNHRTLSDQTGYWVACGRNGYCDNAFAPAVPTDLHHVRCCSDGAKEGWVKQGDQCPYGESNVEVANPSMHNWDEGCAIRKNYADAWATCGKVGARLCTKAELHFDCSSQSGCGNDKEMVWALNSEAIAPHFGDCDESQDSGPNVGGRARLSCCYSFNSDGTCNFRYAHYYYSANLQATYLGVTEVWHGQWRDHDNGKRVDHDASLAWSFFEACMGNSGNSLQSYCDINPSKCSDV